MQQVCRVTGYWPSAWRLPPKRYSLELSARAAGFPRGESQVYVPPARERLAVTVGFT